MPEIGPGTHVAETGAADTERAVNGRLPGVWTEIRSLLDAPADAERPPRAVVEDTLTNGYAYALSLEGERLRIERRLRALLRSEPGVSARVRTEEITALTGLLAEADGELAGIRALLATLRRQAL
jgi:hypothetical protein